MKFSAVVLLLIGVAGFANANGAVTVPEISPASASGAIALLSGALLVVRGRRKK